MQINGYELSVAQQEFPEDHWHNSLHFRNEECIQYNCALLQINHRELLKKYINHVGVCEGTTYLNDWHQGAYGADFTDEEWSELQRLDQEVFPGTN